MVGAFQQLSLRDMEQTTQCGKGLQTLVWVGLMQVVLEHGLFGYLERAAKRDIEILDKPYAAKELKPIERSNGRITG